MPNDWRSEVNKLEADFARLKDKEKEKRISNFYDLSFKVSELTEPELILFHCKLHNALSYKKPFARFSKLKKVHDAIAKRLKDHKYIDKLDNVK